MSFLWGTTPCVFYAINNAKKIKKFELVRLIFLQEVALFRQNLVSFKPWNWSWKLESKKFVDNLGVFVVLLLMLCGCGDKDSGCRPFDESRTVDTVFVERNDTIFVERLDSIFVERIDTLYLPHIEDSSVKKCRSDFDSTFVPGKAVFLGNSLLLGYEDFGMSASELEKDYFHRIKKFFDTNKIPFSAQRVTGSFENMVSLDEQAEYLNARLYPRLGDSVNLVVIQLGDNIDNEPEFSIMEQGLSNLMENVCAMAPNARVLWVGEWYSSSLKQFVLKRLTSDYGISFVDISDLNSSVNQSYVGKVITYPKEKEFSLKYDSLEFIDSILTIDFTVGDSAYKASIKVSSYRDSVDAKIVNWSGFENIVSDPFVASHPNDDAFAEIAKRILAALGYEL